MPNITPHLIKIKNQTNLELETSAILNLNPCDGDGGDGGQKESDGKEPGKEMKVVKEKKLARTSNSKVVQALRLVREVLADRITEKQNSQSRLPLRKSKLSPFPHKLQKMASP